MYIKKTHSYEILPSLTASFECLRINIGDGKYFYIIKVIYRPPSFSKRWFIDELKNRISDMNIDLHNKDGIKKKYIQVLSALQI